MDSLYIIKKQLEECKEKLADYETRLCVNCKYAENKKAMFCICTFRKEIVAPDLNCKNFKRKTNENNK